MSHACLKNKLTTRLFNFSRPFTRRFRTSKDRWAIWPSYHYVLKSEDQRPTLIFPTISSMSHCTTGSQTFSLEHMKLRLVTEQRKECRDKQTILLVHI